MTASNGCFCDDVDLLVHSRSKEKSAKRGGAPQAPQTNVGTSTAFRHDQCKHTTKVNISEFRGQLISLNLRTVYFSYIVLHAQRDGFRATRNHFRAQSSTGAKFGQTGC